MKVYSEIVISIATGEVLFEQAFEYQGPIAKCKGGGGAEVDEDFNDRMAGIAEEELGMSKELFNYMKFGTYYDPSEQMTEKKWIPGTAGTSGGPPRGHTQDADGNWYDQNGLWVGDSSMEWGSGSGGTDGYWDEVPTGQTYGDVYGYKSGGGYITKYMDAEIGGMQASANASNASAAANQAQAGKTTAETERYLALTPIELELAGLTLEKARTLTPLETRNIKLQLELDYPLIQKRADFETLQLDTMTEGVSAGRGLIPLQEQVARGYYDAAINGVNPEQWASMAQNNVEQSFQSSNADARRESARMGLDPKSGNYANQVRQAAIEKARLGGGMRSAGYKAGLDENFNRLGLAANYKPQIYGGTL